MDKIFWILYESFCVICTGTQRIISFQMDFMCKTGHFNSILFSYNEKEGPVQIYPVDLICKKMFAM